MNDRPSCRLGLSSRAAPSAPAWGANRTAGYLASRAERRARPGKLAGRARGRPDRTGDARALVAGDQTGAADQVAADVPGPGGPARKTRTGWHTTHATGRLSRWWHGGASGRAGRGNRRSFRRDLHITWHGGASGRAGRGGPRRFRRDLHITWCGAASGRAGRGSRRRFRRDLHITWHGGAAGRAGRCSRRRFRRDLHITWHGGASGWAGRGSRRRFRRNLHITWHGGASGWAGRGNRCRFRRDLHITWHGGASGRAGRVGSNSCYGRRGSLSPSWSAPGSGRRPARGDALCRPRALRPWCADGRLIPGTSARGQGAGHDGLAMSALQGESCWPGCRRRFRRDLHTTHATGRLSRWWHGGASGWAGRGSRRRFRRDLHITHATGRLTRWWHGGACPGGGTVAPPAGPGRDGVLGAQEPHAPFPRAATSPPGRLEQHGLPPSRTSAPEAACTTRPARRDPTPQRRPEPRAPERPHATRVRTRRPWLRAPAPTRRVRGGGRAKSEPHAPFPHAVPPIGGRHPPAPVRTPCTRSRPCPACPGSPRARPNSG